MFTFRSVAVPLVVGFVTACSPDFDAADAKRETLTSGPGPSLTLLDSLTLQETDSLYIGKPEVGLTVDDSGMIYVADEFWNRVVRFKPDGSIDRVFGHAGDGPGEFRSLTAATTVHDSMIIQPTSARIKIFNRYTGDFMLERRVQPSVMDQAIVNGNDLLVASFDFGTKRGLKVIPLLELLSPDSTQTDAGYASTLVEQPPEFAAYPGLISSAGTTVAAWSDTLLIGYFGVGYVVRYNRMGRPLDTIVLPVRVRRGAGAKGRQVYAKGAKFDFPARVGSHSLLLRLWRLPNGSFLLWHEDNTATKRGANFLLSGTAYVSILSTDGSRACVDARVPFPGSDWPRLTMHGDTLYALDQIASGADSTRAQTIVRRYLVGTDRCSWIKTTSTPP